MTNLSQFHSGFSYSCMNFSLSIFQGKAARDKTQESGLRFKEGFFEISFVQLVTLLLARASTILLVHWYNFSDWFNFFYAGIKRGNVPSFPLSEFYWNQSSSIKVTPSSSGIIAKKSTSNVSFLASYEAMSTYLSTPATNALLSKSYGNPPVTSTLICEGETTLVF